MQAQPHTDGIYSARQDQSPSASHIPSPNAESWYSDADDLSPRASKYFSDLLTLYTARASGDAATTGEQHSLTPSTETRKASVTTMFSRFVASDTSSKYADIAQSKHLEELGTAAQRQSFFKKRYQRLKEIYENGPPGEAQMFWAGVRSYLKEREADIALEICSHKQKDEANRKPLQEAVIQQQGTGQPLRQPPLTHGTIDEDKPQTRKDSVVSYGNISCTSLEVPIKIRRTVLEMDTNKPLPPSPPLSAAPKQRPQDGKGKMMDINKPLPRTPFPCFSVSKKPAQEPVDESPVDAPWPSTHTQAIGPEPSVYQPDILRQDTQGPEYLELKAQQTMRFKDLTNTSKTHLPSTGKTKPSKAEKAHNALKAKISRPIPIPRTVNLSPTLLAPHPGTLSEKAKGKRKIPSSPTWLNKLAHPTMPAMPTIYKPKKRPDSDESFACQGLGEGAMYAEIIDHGALSVGDDRPMTSAGKNSDEMLRPEPLFTGRRSDGSYYDVNDAGAHRRTGRWI